MLSMVMAAARAKSAAFICMIHDGNSELEIDNDNNNDVMVLEDWFGLVASPPAVAAITNNNHVVVAPAVVRFTRAKVPRMNQYESTWWTRYLVPEARASLIDHPNGRLVHGKFCRLFHICSLSVSLLVLFDILTRRWYPHWREYAMCAAGKPVSHIELRLLGSIF